MKREDLADNTIDMLASSAINARDNAYTPYSGFKVGAALLTKGMGFIYTGSNIENASFGAGTCAERAALYRAASAAEREFDAIAVAGWSDIGEINYTAPCGICRQALSEFVDEDFLVILVKARDDYKILTFTEIFPHAFDSTSL